MIWVVVSQIPWIYLAQASYQPSYNPTESRHPALIWLPKKRIFRSLWLYKLQDGMQQIDPKYLHFPAAKSHLLVYPWDNQIAILRYLSLARHTPAYILSPFNTNMMSILILKITPLGGLTVFLETCKWHIGHEFLLKSSVLDELYKKTKHRTEISDFWMSYNSGTTQQKKFVPVSCCGAAQEL